MNNIDVSHQILNLKNNIKKKNKIINVTSFIIMGLSILGIIYLLMIAYFNKNDDVPYIITNTLWKLLQLTFLIWVAVYFISAEAIKNNRQKVSNLINNSDSKDPKMKQFANYNKTEIVELENKKNKFSKNRNKVTIIFIVIILLMVFISAISIPIIRNHYFNNNSDGSSITDLLNKETKLINSFISVDIWIAGISLALWMILYLVNYSFINRVNKTIEKINKSL